MLAHEALAIGLADRVVPAGAALAAALERATQIAAIPQASARFAQGQGRHGRTVDE